MIQSRTNKNRWDTIELRDWYVYALLFALVFIAFFPATQCGYIWDDDDYVTQNETLTSAGGLVQIWTDPSATPQYYPLVHTTYWIEYRVWGLWPAGYHATNIVLHAIAAMLLGKILSRLNVPGAWLAAAIFALHPVHVESVAWVTERKNTLSAVFYLLAALAYFKFRDDDENPRWRFYIAALVLFGCALLSKTVTVTLPAALLLVAWWKSDSISRRDLACLTPMFLVAIPFGLLTVWLEKHHVGIKHFDLGLEPIDRLLVAGRAFWFYAGKLFLPTNLTFIYPRWEVDSVVWWQWLFPLSFFVLVVCLWLAKNRIGRGPLVAILFFAGTLSPALGFVDVFPMRYSFVADHFQYLASIGVIVLFSSAAVQLAAMEPRQFFLRAAPLLVLLGVLTWQQCGVYKNAETLWLDTIEKNPNAAIAFTNLGNIYSRENRNLDEAEKLLSRAIELKSDDQPNVLADAHINRAVVRERLGDLAGAIEDFTVAIDTDREATEYKDRIHLRATLHARHGNTQEALIDIDYVLEVDSRALGVAPDSPNFVLMRAIYRYKIFADKLADEDIERYLKLRPQEASLVRDLVVQEKQNRGEQKP